MPSEIVTWVQLLVKLGLAVWDAYEAGDTSKTVGEIFAGVPRDADVMAEIRERYRKRFEG